MSEFVKLCHCHSLEAAQDARALLEAEGISVRIEGEHASTIFGGSGALLDMRVWVPEDQLEQAQRIVDEFDEPETAEAEDAIKQSEDVTSGGDGESEGKNGDDDTPSRFPNWMWKWSGPGFALFGFMVFLRGDVATAAGLLLVAGLLEVRRFNLRP
jgi:hypothetical protein